MTRGVLLDVLAVRLGGVVVEHAVAEQQDHLVLALVGAEHVVPELADDLVLGQLERRAVLDRLALRRRRGW